MVRWVIPLGPIEKSDLALTSLSGQLVRPGGIEDALVAPTLKIDLERKEY